MKITLKALNNDRLYIKTGGGIQILPLSIFVFNNVYLLN